MIDQIAAAPISWGICEVPNWGVQLPPERVLTEMAELGFTQTEAGAAGYLPDDPSELTAVLNSHGLNLLGGFVPLVLHKPEERAATIAAVHETATMFRDAGAMALVGLAEASHWSGTGIGEMNSAGFTAITEHLTWSRICSAVLPITLPAIPERPTVPITIMLIRSFGTRLGMTTPGLP
jgi:inosose dehydratase